MDPRVAWLMPEQLGPASAIWQRMIQQCLDTTNDSKTEPVPSGPALFNNTAGQINQPFNQPKKLPVPQFTPEQLCQLKEDKIQLLKQYEINELSPIARARDGIKENPAATSHSAYEQIKTCSMRHPWVKTRGKEQKTGVYELHQEIIDFYRWIISTPEEYQMRFEVVLRVEEVIKQEFPGARVEVFGSFQTGLYLPTSDIDMVVFYDVNSLVDHSKGYPNSNPYYRLQERLVQQNIAEKLSIKVIDRAAVPIVKMRDLLTDIKVDISFNMESGVTSVSLIKEFIREFPALPYLVLLLKQFLLQRDMNEVWTGGISSYGLILMTVSFLQQHKRNDGRSPGAKLGVLLIEFFELYGRNFNYEKTCIRVKDGGAYIKKEDMAAQMKQDGGPIGKYYPNYLSIEDPLTPSNDIGRASHGAETVREAFNYAYRILSRAVSPQAASYPSDCTQSILGRIIMITDDVFSYRKWVYSHWAKRVPRLTTPPIIQSQPAQKQNSEVNSVNGASSPERVSESENENDEEPQKDCSGSEDFQPQTPINEYQNTQVLPNFSSQSDNEHHTDSEDLQEAVWLPKGDRIDFRKNHQADEYSPKSYQISIGNNLAEKAPVRHHNFKRTIHNVQPPRSHVAGHYKSRSRDMPDELDNSRPRKSSQSDSNSTHDLYEPPSNPKSPNSSTSPSKRVNITGGIFQKALTSATNTNRQGQGPVGQLVAEKRRQRSIASGDKEDRRRDVNRRETNRKDNKYYEDYEDRRSQRSRRSSDSRGSPIPEEHFINDARRNRVSYGRDRDNRRDDNASPNMAQPRSYRRFVNGVDGGHISPQGYADMRRQGPAMDQPLNYRVAETYDYERFKDDKARNRRKNDRVYKPHRNRNPDDVRLYRNNGDTSGTSGYFETESTRLDVGRSRLNNISPPQRGGRNPGRSRESFSPDSHNNRTR